MSNLTLCRSNSNGLEFEDRSELNADIIVFATGFEMEFENCSVGKSQSKWAIAGGWTKKVKLEVHSSQADVSKLFYYEISCSRLRQSL
jgi:hypothetical protein